MSGDQEPWVFRGGLTADLQVGRQYCACERGTGGGGSVRARHTLRGSGTVNTKHSSLDTTDTDSVAIESQINIKTTELIKSLYTPTVNAWLPAI